MCLGFLKYFSIYNSSFPKYFFASFLAKENNSESFDSSSTIFIPLPPPPAAAFIKIGYPISLHRLFASSNDFTDPSEPSITGKPFFFAIILA